MEPKFICGNKYTISLTNTISLSVLLKGLPSKIVVDGHELFLKNSFHISLVCINQIIKKHNILITSFKDVVVKDFCEFVAKNDVSLLSYEGFRFASQENLKTVIVMCKVSNLDKFFEIINKKYGLNIEYPPSHVTLYAHDGKTGIFLTDSDDIKNLTKSIPNPIGREL